MDGSKKRTRDESEDLTESKRLREADLIFEILDSDAGDGQDPPVDDLADVIRSLEEEIRASRSTQPDFGYLLEASDDDLGLPPAVGSSTDGGDVAGIVDGVGESGLGGMWGPWGLEVGQDEFGVTENERGIFGSEGMFEYSGFVGGPLDYGDFSWQTEFLPLD